MKKETIIGILLGLLIVNIWDRISVGIDYDKLKQEKTKLRHERDMYDSLYRSANTHLMHFQDSINKHCICK